MLSTVFKVLTKLRSVSYDKQWLKSYGFEVPLVSIGNITTGGTGKTPILALLVDWCLNNDLRPAIVSRGYKGDFKGVGKVKIEDQQNYFGDEPSMLANQFPDIPIYVAADRVAAVEELLANEQVDIIFADDAFQHRRLNRDLDIVVLDLLENIENYELLPKGRAREDFTALSRADFIVLNKGNFAAVGAKQQILDKLKTYGIVNKPLVFGDYKLMGINQICSSQLVEAVAETSVFLVSAIGQPVAFEELVKGENLSIEKHLQFADHFRFTKKDYDKIMNEFRATEAQYILCTAKDAVKLKEFCRPSDPIYVVDLKVELTGDVNKIFNEFTRLTR